MYVGEERENGQGENKGRMQAADYKAGQRLASGKADNLCDRTEAE